HFTGHVRAGRGGVQRDLLALRPAVINARRSWRQTDVGQRVGGLLVLVAQLDVVGVTGDGVNADFVEVSGEVTRLVVAGALAEAPHAGSGRQGSRRVVSAGGDLHAVAVQTPDAFGRTRAVIGSHKVDPHGAVGVRRGQLRRLRENVRSCVLARGIGSLAG